MSRPRESSIVRHRRGEDGYTLTELLVVMFILVLLVGLVAPRVIGYLGGAKSDTARIQLNNVESSLDLFLLDTGRYPTEAEGLGALMQKPEGVTAWEGPYLKKESGLQDPWGQAYQYRAPGQHGEYDLFSLGKDKTEGGEGENADITNWK